ncbi:hypothetical protein F4810DRAFT_383317 [Camillea tinctor]|nr:hypothetical protein F4810DRAFT_383317 [Camillea tinctor]
MPSRRSHTKSHHGMRRTINLASWRCPMSYELPPKNRLYSIATKRNRSVQGVADGVRTALIHASCHLTTRFATPEPLSRRSGPRPYTSRRQILISQYAQPTSPFVLGATPTSSNPSTTSTPPPIQNSLASSLAGDRIPSPPLARPLGLDPATRQLLEHYTTQFTLLLFSTHTETEEVLQSFHAAITRHASAYPPIHYAVLSLSALHLASLASPPFTAGPPNLLITALSHQASALAALSATMRTITSPTYEPALVASGLLAACAFALPRAGCPASLDLLAQIISLHRGTAALFRLGRQHAPSPTVRRLRRSVLRASSRAVPCAAEASLARALGAARSLGEGERKRVLAEAGRTLRTALRRAAGQPGAYGVACMWLGAVGEGFAERVRARDRLALVLVAHWAAGALRGVRHVWWVRGWAGWIVDAVWREVRGDPEAEELMGWVMGEVEGDEEVVGGGGARDVVEEV